MMSHPLSDHERECIAAADAHGAKLVVHPVHGLNRWTIEAGIGVEGHVGMRVRRCAQNCTRLGVIEELGTDGGSELAVRWDNYGTQRNVKAGKRGNTYEILTA